jgi:PAS domain S-box-containing protein
LAKAQENRALVPINRGRYLAEMAIVFVAYFLAGKLGQATTNIRSSNLGPVWPAYGIALAAILICGYRVWPAVAVGAFLVAASSPVSAVTAAGQAAGATLAALTGAFLLYRIANFDRALSRLRDALSLIALGGFGSAMVSASIGTLVLYAGSVHAYSGLAPAWLIYWLGDATGVLLVTPLALRFTDLLKVREKDRMTELAVLLLLLTAVCFIVFADVNIIPATILSFIVLPFVMWAAIRFGVGVTALTILIVAAIATVETALGSGPFARNTTFVNAVLLDVFFGVLSVSGLSLAAVIAEREHAEREREKVVSKQAAMEAQLRASDALRESEERLRLALQSGKMYAFDWDVATDVVLRSEEFTNIFGSVGESTSLTRQQFLTRVHPEDRATFMSVGDDVTPDAPIGHASYRVLHDNGAVIWLETHGRAFFDSQGKKLRMIGTVADITQRKQAEEALRNMNRALEEQTSVLQAREELLKIFVKNVPVGVAMLDREMRYLQVSDRWCADYGIDSSQVLGLSHYELFPDMPSHWKQVHRRALEGETVRAEEDRWDREGGTTWVRWEVRPWRSGNGLPEGILIFAEDITRRKQAEEALANMSRKLIEAQEQERTRIARELHDDISQRLALLAIEIEASKQDPPDSPEGTSRLMADLWGRVIEVTSEVQSISHQLHSSQLEYLGIVAAMRSFCREVAARQKVAIDFINDEIPKSVSREISLCLFRVLQEALHNAAKHSKSRHFEVELGCSANQLHLTVSDKGTGFDTETAMNKGGLGLISMRERVRLMNGTLLIESKPSGGTVIHARVPFGPDQILERAAGE